MSGISRHGLFALKRITTSNVTGVNDQCVLFRHHVFLCRVSRRGLFGFKKSTKISAIDQDTFESAAKPGEEQPKELAKQLQPVASQPKNREKFIPITRRSVIRHLMQEPNFLSQEETQRFERFSMALDTTIVNRYHGHLQELKSLFDPIDPDKDTIATREWTRRRRLDNEFWLLHKLSSIMDKANFHRIPKPVVEAALREKNAEEGVMVSVNVSKYDILDFWALGKEKPELNLKWQEKLKYRMTFRPLPRAEEYYKRVVVAVRLKKDDKLILKAFKEVPTHSLEKLLPDGKIKMSKLDKTLMSTTIGLVATGLVAKLVSYLAHVHVEWTVLLTFVAGLTATRAWTVYKNRKNAYLVELSRLLYFRNIANNRGLLALLVDRAEDELFKESLLAYTFLLTTRPPSLRDTPTQQQDPESLGGITATQLESRIEEWVMQKTQNNVQFDSTDAVILLKELGVLSEDPETQALHVLNLEAALRNLPITPQSVIDRAEEFDQLEGYDREEPDPEYEQEEKKRKTYGWF